MKSMMHKLAALLASVGVVALVALPAAAATGNPIFDDACKNSPDSALCKQDKKLFGAGSLFNNIINTMIYIVGAVAVLMIVIGGLRYVLSGGDQAAVKSSKDTILYAVIGIVIAIMAYAIVNFVLTRL